MQTLKEQRGASKKTLVTGSLILALAATLFSFTIPKGGDSFEIYLNKKLVVQQYVIQMKGVSGISLEQSAGNEQIDIYYRHCGVTGKDRTITLKDRENRTLKQWRFADATGKETAMTCTVKDILDLQKMNGNGNLQLYYSAKEMPGGKLLAYISRGNSSRITQP